MEVRIAGELDLASAEELERCLRDELTGGRAVLLDISAVTFIDSTGLSALLAGVSLAEQRGGEIAFRDGLAAQPRRLMELTGVWERLPRIAPDDDPPR